MPTTRNEQPRTHAIEATPSWPCICFVGGSQVSGKRNPQTASNARKKFPVDSPPEPIDDNRDQRSLNERELCEKQHQHRHRDHAAAIALREAPVEARCTGRRERNFAGAQIRFCLRHIPLCLRHRSSGRRTAPSGARRTWERQGCARAAHRKTGNPVCFSTSDSSWGDMISPRSQGRKQKLRKRFSSAYFHRYRAWALDILPLGYESGCVGLTEAFRVVGYLNASFFYGQFWVTVTLPSLDSATGLEAGESAARAIRHRAQRWRSPRAPSRDRLDRRESPTSQAPRTTCRTAAEMALSRSGSRAVRFAKSSSSAKARVLASNAGT